MGEPFPSDRKDQELREMSGLMFFEIPEKEGFSFEMWESRAGKKNLYSQGWGYADLGNKNLKF